MELVQEIHHLLMDREDTCHRTCFSLQLDGVTLDNFAELKNIEGLEEGSLIRVVEEAYTVREARIHVRHVSSRDNVNVLQCPNRKSISLPAQVRDLLKSLDSADAYNGIDCSSLSFLNVIAQGDILGINLAMCFTYDLLSLSICFHPRKKERSAPRRGRLHTTRIYLARM